MKNIVTLTQDKIDNFWKRVIVKGDDDCWEWQGNRNRDGYGRLYIEKVKGKTIHESAHRVSWIIRFGEIPKDLYVCHKCDNPACCNWHHLFLGTQSQNMVDMYRKGRVKRLFGENHPLSKLNEEKVLEIRKLVSEKKKTYEEIASLYGISTGTIVSINSGRAWKWLK